MTMTMTTDDDEGLLGRFLPSHSGSMWNFGLTIYF